MYGEKAGTLFCDCPCYPVVPNSCNLCPSHHSHLPPPSAKELSQHCGSLFYFRSTLKAVWAFTPLESWRDVFRIVPLPFVTLTCHLNVFGSAQTSQSKCVAASPSTLQASDIFRVNLQLCSVGNYGSRFQKHHQHGEGRQ